MVLRCNKDSRTGGSDYFAMISPLSKDSGTGRKLKGQNNDCDGVGTRTCFPFRPPRSITTDSYQWSQQEKDRTRLEQEYNTDIDHTWDAEDSSYHQHPFSTLQQSKKSESMNRSQTPNQPPSLQINKEGPLLSVNTEGSNVMTPTSKNLSNLQAKTPDVLLSMPKPTDRSHRQRLKTEREGGQVHTYIGELEPAGFRGQEAQVEKSTQIGSPYLQLSQQGAALRLFEESSPSRISIKDQDNSLNTSLSSEVEIREMVSDLVPLTPSVEERSKRNNKSVDVQKRVRNDIIPTSSSYGHDSREINERTNKGQFLFSITKHRSDTDLQSLSRSNIQSSDVLATEDLQVTDAPAKFKSYKSSLSIDIKGISDAAEKHVKLGEFDLAVCQYGRILDFYRNHYGDPHPLVASAHHNLGIVHSKKAEALPEETLQQNYSRQQALLSFQAAARTARDSLSKNHPNVAVSLVKVGYLLLCSKQYQVALIAFKEALRIRLIHFGNNPNPLIANLHNNMGTCQLQLRNFQESNQHFTKALQIQRHLLRVARIIPTEEVLQGDTLQMRLLEVADTLSNLGGLGLEWLRQKGANNEILETAELQLTEAIGIRSSILGREHPLTIEVIDLHQTLMFMSPKVFEKYENFNAANLASDADERKEDSNKVETKLNNTDENQSSIFDGIDDPWSPYSPETLELNYSSRSEGFHDSDSSPSLHSFKSISPQNFEMLPPREFKFSKSSSQDVIFDYDTEEYCLVSGKGEKEYFSAPSVLQLSKDDMNGENNVSSHEITVLCPSIDGPFQQSVARNLEAQDKFSRYDDGIAPLYRSTASSRIATNSITSSMSQETKQNATLTGSMLDDPGSHLVEVHAAASRCLKRNRFAEAQYLFSIIFECQRKALGESHADVGAALHNLGLAYLMSNDHIKALGYFERAVKTRKGSLGMDHPEVAISQFKVGVTLLLMRNFALSLPPFRSALSIRKRKLGATHLSIARIYNNIGCILVEANELSDAKQAFEAALDIQRNALSHEPRSEKIMYGAASTLCNLGYLYQHREMHQKVTIVLKEALDLQICVLGSTHRTVLTTMDNLADALSLSEGCTEALRYYSKILSKLKKVDVAKNKWQTEAVVLYKMSRIHRQQKHNEAELDTLKRALEAVKAISVRTDIEKKTKVELERYIRSDILSSPITKKKGVDRNSYKV